MDELRLSHLGSESPARSPSVRERLNAAYLRCCQLLVASRQSTMSRGPTDAARAVSHVNPLTGTPQVTGIAERGCPIRLARRRFPHRDVLRDTPKAAGDRRRAGRRPSAPPLAVRCGRMADSSWRPAEISYADDCGCPARSRAYRTTLSERQLPIMRLEAEAARTAVLAFLKQVASGWRSRTCTHGHPRIRETSIRYHR